METNGEHVLLHFVVRGAVNPAAGMFSSPAITRPSDRNGSFADRQEDTVCHQEQRNARDRDAQDRQPPHPCAGTGTVYLGWEWDGT